MNKTEEKAHINTYKSLTKEQRQYNEVKIKSFQQLMLDKWTSRQKMNPDTYFNSIIKVNSKQTAGLNIKLL